MEKKLYKSRTDKKWEGVCAGIAKYFGIDPTLVRLIWALASLFSGGITGFIVYFVCDLVLPTEPDDFVEV